MCFVFTCFYQIYQFRRKSRYFRYIVLLPLQFLRTECLALGYQFSISCWRRLLYSVLATLSLVSSAKSKRKNRLIYGCKDIFTGPSHARQQNFHWAQKWLSSRAEYMTSCKILKRYVVVKFCAYLLQLYEDCKTASKGKKLAHEKVRSQSVVITTDWLRFYLRDISSVNCETINYHTP